MGGGSNKRDDLKSFYKNKENLLIDYLELRMDGSAILATYKREFLLKHRIYFTKHFHEEEISLDLLARICLLFASLVKIGVEVVFFDELLRERIPLLSKDNLIYIENFLLKNNLKGFLENPKKYQKRVCIWGYNTNTKLLLQKSSFLREIEELHIIDSENIGKNIDGINKNFKVEDPLIFKDSNYPILISAVQGSPRIYEEFIEKGFNKNRLIRGVVI